MTQKGLVSSAHLRRILGTLIPNSLKKINKNKALNAFWDYSSLIYCCCFLLLSSPSFPAPIPLPFSGVKENIQCPTTQLSPSYTSVSFLLNHHSKYKCLKNRDYSTSVPGLSHLPPFLSLFLSDFPCWRVDNGRSVLTHMM